MGGSNGMSCQQQPGGLERRLGSVDVDLTRSKSTRQPKFSGGMMMTLRKKVGRNNV